MKKEKQPADRRGAVAGTLMEPWSYSNNLWKSITELMNVALDSFIEAFTSDSPVTIEIPGTKKEDIKITVEPLAIETRGSIKKEDIGLVTVRTPKFYSFQRIAYRPGLMKNPAKYLSSNYENGVLTLFLEGVTEEEKEKAEKEKKASVVYIPVD